MEGIVLCLECYIERASQIRYSIEHGGKEGRKKGRKEGRKKEGGEGGREGRKEKGIKKYCFIICEPEFKRKNFTSSILHFIHYYCWNFNF